MSTSLVTLPTPSQLPAPVAEAYEAAMAEVLNLVRSPQVQQRFAAVLLSELRTQRALQQCTPQSIVLAVVEMVQHGLDPSASNECYLIPYTVYENGRPVRTEAQLQLGYAGLVKLACAHPDVEDILADCVHKEDHYRYLGIDCRPEHIIPEGFQPRGPLLGVYGLACLTRGRKRCLQMSVDEIKDHARRYSRNHDKKVWSDGPGGGFQGMALKTILRKLCNPKYLPMAGRVAELVIRGELIEGELLSETAVVSREHEQSKTLPEHLEDLGYDTPGTPSPTPPAPSAPPTTTAEAPPSPTPEQAGNKDNPSDDPTDTRVLRAELDNLLVAHGFTSQQRREWYARQCKRFRIKEFARVSADCVRGLLEELHQLPLATEPPPEAPWRAALQATAARTTELIEQMDDDQTRSALLELCTQALHAGQDPATTAEQAETLTTQLYQASDQAAQALGLTV